MEWWFHVDIFSDGAEGFDVASDSLMISIGISSSKKRLYDDNKSEISSATS